MSRWRYDGSDSCISLSRAYSGLRLRSSPTSARSKRSKSASVRGAGASFSSAKYGPTTSAQNVRPSCIVSWALRLVSEWKIRLRTAVTGCPLPVGICSSPRPDSDCSSVLLPLRARPLTPMLTVRRDTRARVVANAASALAAMLCRPTPSTSKTTGGAAPSSSTAATSSRATARSSSNAAIAVHRACSRSMSGSLARRARNTASIWSCTAPTGAPFGHREAQDRNDGTVVNVPEGDTVYLAGKRLRAALAGQRLVRGELRHPRLVDHDLAGLTVLDVVSVGKHLFTRLDDGRSLHSHFRMDGSWHLYRPGMAWHRPAYEARAVLATEERVAVGFALHDLELLPTAEEHRLVGHLGPDLLDPAWSAEHAAEALRRLTARGASEIGMVLLEQRVMAGIGNLYKTEACFLRGVSPWTLTADVPDPAGMIALARKLLVRNADRPEQTTTGELSRGRQHWVFERAGQRCRRCGTRIRTASQGDGVYARVAYWCPTCQPGPAPAR